MLTLLRRYKGGLIWLGLKAIGFIPSHNVRKLCYRFAGMTIGKRSFIYSGAEVRQPSRIVIGDDVIVGHNAILDGRGGLTVGDNVNLSTGVWIWTMQHDHNSPEFTAVASPVHIKKNSWLSARVVVLPGVTVEEGAVIAAGAVVTKSTKEYHLYGGIPAKVIGQRNRNISYRLGAGGATPFI